MKNIEVSIVLVSYNHENYIKKALDSILMQNVNFNYEIVFADDCSTDNTQKIIKEISKTIKNKKYIFNKKNRGNTYNSLNAYKNCKGKYIIALEADDYWTSNEKLQIQYDFLEKNKDYIAVSDKRYTIDKKGKKITSYPTWVNKDTDISINDILNDKWFSGIETMFKNIFIENLMNDKFCEIYLSDRMIGDMPLCVFLASMGKIRILNKDMAVYRTSSSGNISNYNYKQKLTDIAESHIKIVNRLNDYYNGKYDFSKIYANHLMESLIGCILCKNFNHYKKMLQIIPKENITKVKKSLIKKVPEYFLKVIRKIIYG